MSGADSENDGQSSVQSQIEDICVGVVKELNRQGLTETKEAFLEIQKPGDHKEAAE